MEQQSTKWEEEFPCPAERLGGAALAPVTLIPVPRLFSEGHLIEIDSTAVLA